jgi:hypothetical protein
MAWACELDTAVSYLSSDLDGDVTNDREGDSGVSLSGTYVRDPRLT